MHVKNLLSLKIQRKACDFLRWKLELVAVDTRYLKTLNNKSTS